MLIANLTIKEAILVNELVCLQVKGSSNCELKCYLNIPYLQTLVQQSLHWLHLIGTDSVVQLEYRLFVSI